MKTYMALLRIRFQNGLQYRTAALAGLSTQFAWGFMELLAFSAFYRVSPDAFPMTFAETVSYIWCQQAFLALFASWGYGGEAVQAIISGDIAYDLCRPLDLYDRWFMETVAQRLSSASLRCLPVLFIALVLPQPFRLVLPQSVEQTLLFVVAMILGMLVVTAFCLIDYMTAFYTMTRTNLVFGMVMEFLSGAIIPLPFFPGAIRRVVELLPFASMQNMPLRIFGGHITGYDAYCGIALQFIWLLLLILLGKAIMRHALGRVVAQGG